MITSLLQSNKELINEKENESNWFKIYTMFEQLNKSLKQKEDVEKCLNVLTDILIRSILSDRSRLNGIALDFLKTCLKMADDTCNFSIFLPILIKTVGRSNKVFYNRGLEALVVITPVLDTKCILRSINDNINSINKNIRFGVYTIVTHRMNTDEILMKPFVEKGIKDPALEIRTLLKKIEVKEIKEAPKKTQVVSTTPRKIFKLDKGHEQIKMLENEVNKITKEDVIPKVSTSDFLEKLQKLKQSKRNVSEKPGDEMTPRRLDKYLDKFRAKPVQFPDNEEVVQVEAQNNQLPHGLVENDTTNLNAEEDICESTTVIQQTPVNSLIGGINLYLDPSISQLSKEIEAENAGPAEFQAKMESDENNLIEIEYQDREYETTNKIAPNETVIEKDVLEFESTCHTGTDVTKWNVNNNAVFQEEESLSLGQQYIFNIETALFKKEMHSSEIKNDSLVHMALTNDALGEIASDPNNGGFQASLLIDYEDNKNSGGVSQQIEDLSKSFINISIEPSFIEKQSCKLDDIEVDKNSKILSLPVVEPCESNHSIFDNKMNVDNCDTEIAQFSLEIQEPREDIVEQFGPIPFDGENLHAEIVECLNNVSFVVENNGIYPVCNLEVDIKKDFITETRLDSEKIEIYECYMDKSCQTADSAAANFNDFGSAALVHQSCAEVHEPEKTLDHVEFSNTLTVDQKHLNINSSMLEFNARFSVATNENIVSLHSYIDDLSTHNNHAVNLPFNEAANMPSNAAENIVCEENNVRLHSNYNISANASINYTGLANSTIHTEICVENSPRKYFDAPEDLQNDNKLCPNTIGTVLYNSESNIKSAEEQEYLDDLNSDAGFNELNDIPEETPAGEIQSDHINNIAPDKSANENISKSESHKDNLCLDQKANSSFFDTCDDQVLDSYLNSDIFQQERIKEIKKFDDFPICLLNDPNSINNSLHFQDPNISTMILDTDVGMADLNSTCIFNTNTDVPANATRSDFPESYINVAMSTVVDRGVLNAFSTESNSKIKVHELFDADLNKSKEYRENFDS